MINLHSLYTRLYGSLYNRKHLPTWIFSPIRKLLRISASYQLAKYFTNSSRPDAKLYCKNIIVSLTTFPARINDVWMTIECLLRQTYMPEKIILWLSKNQFPNKNALPEALLKLENKIFEIRFVDGDIRSHKKYVYAFKEFPTKLVVTVDDDLIYSPNLIENLVKAHELYPNDVLCCYAKKLDWDEAGCIKPYNCWPVTSDIDCSQIFFGSGGGTLFQPSNMYKDVLNIELSNKLTPLADDVWLNAMCRLSNLKIRLITKNLFFFLDKNEDLSLSKQNVEMQRNDIQINNITEYYTKAIGINPFAYINN